LPVILRFFDWVSMTVSIWISLLWSSFERHVSSLLIIFRDNILFRVDDRFGGYQAF
jgi:hypothetical protein